MCAAYTRKEAFQRRTVAIIIIGAAVFITYHMGRKKVLLDFSEMFQCSPEVTCLPPGTSVGFGMGRSPHRNSVH